MQTSAALRGQMGLRSGRKLKEIMSI